MGNMVTALHVHLNYNRCKENLHEPSTPSLQVPVNASLVPGGRHCTGDIAASGGRGLVMEGENCHYLQQSGAVLSA